MLKMYEKQFYDGMTVQKQYKRPQQKHYLKVTDDASGEIAASGVWVYLPEGYCPEDEYVVFFWRLISAVCSRNRFLSLERGFGICVFIL